MTSHELARWLLDNEDVPVMRWDQEYHEYFPVAVSGDVAERHTYSNGDTIYAATSSKHETKAWLKIVVVE